MSEELVSVCEKYDVLKSEYDALQTKYEQLLRDYSENTIIESMNDMKRRYDEIVERSVPIYKFSVIEEKYKKMTQGVLGVDALVTHVIKSLKELENVALLDKHRLHKLTLELIIIKEILQDC